MKVAESEYLDATDEEIRDSMGLVSETQYRDLFARYVGPVSAWVQRYADNDWVIGYNLLNEPLLNTYGIDRINLRNFYVQLTDSIRTVDDKGLLFIDGDNYATEFHRSHPAVGSAGCIRFSLLSAMLFLFRS